MKKCVYAGSFDPLTLGHMHVIERCSMMFDEVIVALGVNAEKKAAYSKADRLKMLELATASYRNVRVCEFDGLLVDFMKKEEAVYYARGIRNEKDMDYEERTFAFNSEHYPEIITLFFTAPKRYSSISSTEVRKLIKEGKSVKKYVPEEIYEYLKGLKIK